MLTSEYFALDGALVLAVPTKPGQELYYTEQQDEQSLILWETYHQNQLWLRIKIDYSKWTIIATNLQEPAEFILKVLKILQQTSSEKLQSKSSYYLKSNIQFPANFGLGSSSTLMNNLAEWAKVDPFILNEKCLGGSGYDIAVAQAKTAILYQAIPERKYEKVDFKPDFRDQLLFIHLNQKQNSRDGIKAYREKEKSTTLVDEFTMITNEVIHCKNINHFSDLMKLHEQKVADFLKTPTSRDRFFKDCPSFIKSLGAWGGDFVMAQKFEGYIDWFEQRGYVTIFGYNELIY